jgi:proteasome lid subunit RPN8/RPN11
MTRLPWKRGPLSMHAGPYFVSATRFTYASKAPCGLLGQGAGAHPPVMRALRQAGRIAVLSCVAWTLIAPAGQAAVHPVAMATPDAVCHGSIREAAVAGILEAAQRSRRVEYGGALLQYGTQCFIYTDPVTSNQPNRLDYVIRTARGRALLVGIYHTHTPGGHASEFSECDRAAQKRLRVPSFVGAMAARGHGVTVRSLGEVDGNGINVPAVQMVMRQ